MFRSGVRRPIVFGLIAFLPISVAFAQAPQHFEVTVIRPAQASENAGLFLSEGGKIRIVNEPIKLLLRLAFHLQDAQIAGGPKWLDTDRYDIEAEVEQSGRISPDQMAPLMQDLLSERFNLKFHREKREITVYALLPAKGGPKFKSKAEGDINGMNSSGGPQRSHLIATATSMALLAGYVGNRLNQIVVDKTGLTDSYDFTLDWAPEEAPDSTVPSLVTALQEQLGLHLESQKAPVDVLVVDTLDRPSEN